MLTKAAAIVLALAPAAPCLAQSLDATSPSKVLIALHDLGFRAAQDIDDAGDPRILSSTNGKQFRILFYGCENGESCQSIQFTSGFDLDQPMPADQVNGWNSANRFAKVALDQEGDPYLDYDVNLASGGVPVANFNSTVALWDSLMGEFITYVGW